MLKRNAALLISAICTVAVISIPAAEAADTFEFSFAADKKIITLGEELTLSLNFLASDDFEIIPVEDNGQFDPLEVKSITHNTTPSVKSIRSESYTIKLTTFAFGSYDIKPFAVKFRVKGGEERLVYTNPVNVQCVSVVGSDSELKEIKPIKGQESLPKKNLPVWVFFVLAGVFLMAVFSLIKWVPVWIAGWKERQLTPYERAMKKLNQLAVSGAKNGMSAYQFYADLSVAFRDALILGCKVGSSNMTTAEWEAYALKNPLLAGRQKEISHILRASDMAKFAGAQFDENVSRKTAESALNLVNEFLSKLPKTEPVKS